MFLILILLCNYFHIFVVGRFVAAVVVVDVVVVAVVTRVLITDQHNAPTRGNTRISETKKFRLFKYQENYNILNNML